MEIAVPAESSNSLANKIRGDIVSGLFAPGKKLTEVELAERFGVSRTPLRQCLFELASSGLLQYQQNRGFTVPSLSKDELRECYPIIWRLEQLALERGFNLLATRTAVLTESNKRFLAAVDDPAVALACDGEFHRLICQASGNTTLNGILADLKSRMQRYDVVFLSDKALLRQSHTQHCTLIQQIAAGSLPEVLQTLEANWRCGLEYFLSCL